MKITKKQMLWALPLVALTMGGCKLDKGEMRQTYPAIMNQMVVPDDASKDITVQSQCVYSIAVDLMENNLVLNSSSVEINGQTMPFTTDAIGYNYGYNGSIESFVFAAGGQGLIGNDTPVTDIKGYLSATASRPQVTVLAMNYRIPGATVRTFQTKPIFAGTTTTQYKMAGVDMTAETKDATYGVVFDKTMKKASVIIYNIKFAPTMPSALESVIVKDLDVEYTRTGYVLTGADIIPDVVEGGATTPYENFPFTSIRLETTDEFLTEMKCDYVVDATIKGMKMHFLGSFTGKSADFVRYPGTEE